MDTTGPPEGTWQYEFGAATTHYGSQVALWAFDHSGVVFGVATGLLLCGTAMGARYIYRRIPEKGIRKVYNRVVRNPWSKLARPFRRFHRKWSERNQRIKMAKWKKGHLTDAFLNAIDNEYLEGRLSRQERRRLQNQIATFFELPDLARKSTHPSAVERRIKANKTSKTGPVKEIPGPRPGENTVPMYEGLGHGYLDRKKAATG